MLEHGGEFLLSLCMFYIFRIGPSFKHIQNAFLNNLEKFYHENDHKGVKIIKLNKLRIPIGISFRLKVSH